MIKDDRSIQLAWPLVSVPLWFTVGAARRIAKVKGVDSVALVDPSGTRKVVRVVTIDPKWDRKCISTFCVTQPSQSLASSDDTGGPTGTKPPRRKRVLDYSGQPLMAAAMLTIVFLGFGYTLVRR